MCCAQASCSPHLLPLSQAALLPFLSQGAPCWCGRREEWRSPAGISWRTAWPAVKPVATESSNEFAPPPKKKHSKETCCTQVSSSRNSHARREYKPLQYSLNTHTHTQTRARAAFFFFESAVRLRRAATCRPGGASEALPAEECSCQCTCASTPSPWPQTLGEIQALAEECQMQQH